MLTFEWNALRPGDTVLAHDPHDPERALTAGVVAMVDVHKGRKGVNRVGIGVPASDGTTVILWPARLAVHPDPRDLTEACWRCQAEALHTHELAGVAVPEPSG